jgi:hypothetical protein
MCTGNTTRHAKNRTQYSGSKLNHLSGCTMHLQVAPTPFIEFELTETKCNAKNSNGFIQVSEVK